MLTELAFTIAQIGGNFASEYGPEALSGAGGVGIGSWFTHLLVRDHVRYVEESAAADRASIKELAVERHAELSKDVGKLAGVVREAEAYLAGRMDGHDERLRRVEMDVHAMKRRGE